MFEDVGRWDEEVLTQEVQRRGGFLYAKVKAEGEMRIGQEEPAFRKVEERLVVPCYWLSGREGASLEI